MTLPTFGVEEEFLLLDRVSGLPMWVADAVLEGQGALGHGRPSRR